MKVWIRNIQVTFSSTLVNKSVTYGSNDELSISISGSKYMSCLKDNFTITISNMSYKHIVELILYKFNKVDIKVGYRNSGNKSIFKGAVLYISNKMVDKANKDVIIVCTSEMLGIYNERLLNLSLNSGINMYSALEFICKSAGIPKTNISNEFKARIITDTLNTNGGVSSIIDTICNSNSTVFCQTDNSENSILTIWDAYREDKRVIKLNKDNILISQGYPTISQEGLTINVLPTFNFMPGDVIAIDNSIIDMSLGSKDEVLNTPSIASYLDTNGEYMIYELSYQLENRGSNFYIRMLCKKRSLMKGLIENA